MTTTTVHRRLCAHSPFDFLETRQVLRLAVRIEHLLELWEAAARAGQISRERHREAVRHLRRRIDDLQDVSRDLTESAG